MLSRRMMRWAAAAAVSCLLFLAGFVLRPGAAAQAVVPPQVSLGQHAPMLANILVKVPLTITCAPRSPDTILNVVASLEQAAPGGRIAHGGFTLTSNTSFGPGQLLPPGVACDNAPHYIGDILADATGAPFGDGPSIVAASVTVCTLQQYSQSECASTIIAPRVITLAASKDG